MIRQRPFRDRLASDDPRTAELIHEASQSIQRPLDRIVAALLVVEWAICLALAVSISGPGRSSEIWWVVFPGGLTICLPVILVILRPGRFSSRMALGVGLIGTGRMMISLAQGGIEMDFPILGALACLAIYRDARLLLSLAVFVLVEPWILRWVDPSSVLVDSPSRIVEESAWIVFEVMSLLILIFWSLDRLRQVCHRQAELEAERERILAFNTQWGAELTEARSVLKTSPRFRLSFLESAHLSLHQDVSDSKLSEERLLASERNFRTLVELVPQMVGVSLADGDCVFSNARWHEYTGQSTLEARGNGWVQTIHPDDHARILETWTKALSIGQAVEMEYRIRRHDGAYRWHLIRSVPLRDESGQVLRWLATCTDIEDQKRAEEALRKSREELEVRVHERTEELEQANKELMLEVAERRKLEVEATRFREAAEIATRAKSEFLANMSHEIRTPMSAIIGMTELLLTQEISPDQQEKLEVVRTSADSLLELINDILDFSKIEAGKLDLDAIPFRPRESIAATIKTLSLRAIQKDVEISTYVAPEIPEALVGDPLRIRQVLLNLISNAIKFTSGGRIEVRLEVEQHLQGTWIIRCSVRDTGIGIPSQRLGMIFDPFSQAEGSTARTFGGTGLGLAICSKLVKLMGGRIWVESQINHGSTFHFTARLTETVARVIDPPSNLPSTPKLDGPRKADTPLRKLRILLVDDHDFNRRVGSLLLEKIGHRVDVASDGPSAIELYQSNLEIDLILMDVQMPGMDGLETTRLIREIQKQTGRSTPIIALTAHAMKGDRERCLKAGMDEHLSKPIRIEVLSRSIEAILNASPATIEEATPEIDFSTIRATFPENGHELNEVIGLFRDVCHEQQSAIRSALEAGDATGLTQASHRLIGSLGIFAPRTTAMLATRLQDLGRSGLIEEARPVFHDLEQAIDRLQPALDRLVHPEKADRSGRNHLISVK